MEAPWKTRKPGFSTHAVTRMQQRGIDVDAVDLLFRYGREQHDHHGGTILYFDRAARVRITREFDREALRALRSKLRIYAVLGHTGNVITVGHRHERIRRH